LRQRRYRFVDLFAGAGGLSLGFVQAGCTPIWAVEIDPAAAATYEANFGCHVFCGDIREVKTFTIYQADFVIGGPPCQGFSPLGKMSAKKTRIQKHKELNSLWLEFLRAVKEIKPLGFLVENVPEFLRTQACSEFRSRVADLGYDTAAGVLNAEEFGVPQKRRRGFIIGILHGFASLPKPTGERMTVRDAIGDLPLEPTEENLHFGRNPRPISIERYKCIPPGGNRFDLMRKRPDLCPKCWLKKPTGSTDVFGRLRWDEPALTIRTEFFKPEKGRYLHPEAHRPITHREAARLQTFPDSFEFRGTKIEIARQIGNAVPPKLAKHLALHMIKLVEEAQRVQDSALSETSTSPTKSEKNCVAQVLPLNLPP